MALVTKNDVTQIFAIQAPEIDLPPTFENYPRGWDTARSNNGKPTIKQFNYIQQRTDQNVLWIHQNGAALPYDATMEYAENSHVVKDGVLQKKQGAGWVIPYLGKSNNLDDVLDKATARTNLDVYSKAQTDANIAAAAITPDATEIVAGKAKIATTAIAQEGVNDTDFMTPAKVRSVSFGQGQTRKSRTLVSGVEYTNTNNKAIIVGFSLRSNQGVNAQMPVNIKLGDITVLSNTFSGSTDYRTAHDFTILPQEKYTFTIGNSTTFFDVAWEIS